DSSSGVSADLAAATRLAAYMEGYWGMGSTVSSHPVLQDLMVGGGRPDGAPAQKLDSIGVDLFAGSLGQRIEDKLGELMRATEQLLRQNRAEVLAVAHALETHRTVTGEDIGAVVDGRPGTLIDGRPYHAPEAIAALEAYHRQAVAAHQEHSRVAMALPVFAPFAAGVLA